MLMASCVEAVYALWHLLAWQMPRRGDQELLDADAPQEIM